MDLKTYAGVINDFSISSKKILSLRQKNQISNSVALSALVSLSTITLNEMETITQQIHLAQKEVTLSAYEDHNASNDAPSITTHKLFPASIHPPSFPITQPDPILAILDPKESYKRQFDEITDRMTAVIHDKRITSQRTMRGKQTTIHSIRRNAYSNHS